MNRYILCSLLVLCLQLFGMKAQDRHGEKRQFIYYKHYIGLPLDSLLLVLPQPFQPYELIEDPVTQFIHFTILLYKPYSSALQVKLLLQPRYIHYSKLRPWDAASTVEWTIRTLDTALIDKPDQQTVRNRYCLDVILYHYKYPSEKDLGRRMVMPHYFSWDDVPLELREPFRQAFEQLTGQKP